MLSLLIKITSLYFLIQYATGIYKKDSFKMLFANKDYYKEEMDRKTSELVENIETEIYRTGLFNISYGHVFFIIFVSHIIALVLPLFVVHIPAFISLVLFEIVRSTVDYFITYRIMKCKAKDYEYMVDHVSYTFSFVTYPLYIAILILSLF